MGENTSFIAGIAGIGASFIVVLMDWMPLWVIFGTLVLAGLLYGTKFFATGVAGGFSSGVMASLGWIPLFAYFTAIVLATVFLAVRIAQMYFGLGSAGATR